MDHNSVLDGQVIGGPVADAVKLGRLRVTGFWVPLLEQVRRAVGEVGRTPHMGEVPELWGGREAALTWWEVTSGDTFCVIGEQEWVSEQDRLGLFRRYLSECAEDTVRNWLLRANVGEAQRMSAALAAVNDLEHLVVVFRR